MKNFIRITESLLLLLILLFVRPVGADDWHGPRTIVAFSDSGDFFVRIVPGKSYGDVIGFAGEPKGSYAKAEFYSRQRDRSFKLLWEKELLNPVSPYQVLISDSGYVMTFDNWHNLGYGKVVAIYGPDGAVLGSYTLDELYPSDRINDILRSVSSRYWRCGGPVFTDPKAQAAVVVHEALGGQFVFDLRTAAFQYTPGHAPCERG